jgi:hypothetical protein
LSDEPLNPLAEGLFLGEPTGPVTFVSLSPLHGVFLPAGLSPPSLDVELEPGFSWQMTEETHRELFDRWVASFDEAMIPSEVGYWRFSSTVLVGEETVEANGDFGRDEAHRRFSNKLLFFLVAASLHVRAGLLPKELIFRLNEDGSKDPVAGAGVMSTGRLGAWPGQAEIDSETVTRIVDAFPVVKRSFAARMEHPFRRAVGMFRGALSAVHVEPVCILLCAALECLGSFSASKIPDNLVRRLIGRYSSDPPGDEATLRGLYDLRSAYVHGAPYWKWPTVEERLQVIEEGMALTKEILRGALGDDELYRAAEAGKKAHRAYLDQ